MPKKRSVNPAQEFEKVLNEIRARRQRRPSKRSPPKLRDHIVGFVDLLGFRNQVLSMSAKEARRTIETLEFLFSGVVEAHKPMDGDPMGIEVRFFSDCFCLALPLDNPDLQNYLDRFFWFFIHVVHIQGEFIFNGHILRGGISVGPHYSSEHLIFSPAQIRAYETESKVATYPMVMLDDSVFDAMDPGNKRFDGQLHPREAAALKHDLESVFGLIAEDESGKSFINYLRFWTELDDPTRADLYFAAHKKVIEDGAKRFLKSPHVLEKYRWMARYHNAYLKKHLTSPGEMLIGDSLFGAHSLPEERD